MRSPRGASHRGASYQGSILEKPLHRPRYLYKGSPWRNDARTQVKQIRGMNLLFNSRNQHGLSQFSRYQSVEGRSNTRPDLAGIRGNAISEDVLSERIVVRDDLRNGGRSNLAIGKPLRARERTFDL